MKYVSLEKNERTAWVAMNRPEAMNSLTAELCAELVEAFAECERDAEIRAVVLTGSGRAFCAGGDLPTLAALKSRDEAEEYVKTAGRVALAIVRSAKPYIAMVNGAAAGAGFNIALACDFLCASKNAKFTQAFSSIGLIADCGGNVTGVHYEKGNTESINGCFLRIEMETRDNNHVTTIKNALREAGFRTTKG